MLRISICIFSLIGPIVEVARCWGSASAIAAAAEQNAARITLHRLRDELDLHIKVSIIRRGRITKYIDHLTNQYAVLLEKYDKVQMGVWYVQRMPHLNCCAEE